MKLAFSARLITFEIGIRFLADYLQGDRYSRSIARGTISTARGSSSDGRIVRAERGGDGAHRGAVGVPVSALLTGSGVETRNMHDIYLLAGLIVIPRGDGFCKPRSHTPHWSSAAGGQRPLPGRAAPKRALPVRRDTPEEAVRPLCPARACCCWRTLSDQLTLLTEALYAEARRKGLRLYVEFPSCLPGQTAGMPARVGWERRSCLGRVRHVSRETLHPRRPRLPLCSARRSQSHLVLARVAGSTRSLRPARDDDPPPLRSRPRPAVASSSSAALSGHATARRLLERGLEVVLDRLSPAPRHSLRWTPAVILPTKRLVQCLQAMRRARCAGAWTGSSSADAGDSFLESVYEKAAVAWPDRVGRRRDRTGAAAMVAGRAGRFLIAYPAGRNRSRRAGGEERLQRRRQG